MTNLSMDMGYQRENLTWPQNPLVLNEMDINGFRKKKINSQQMEF